MFCPTCPGWDEYQANVKRQLEERIKEQARDGYSITIKNYDLKLTLYNAGLDKDKVSEIMTEVAKFGH